MIRKLKPGDFMDVWELAKTYIDPRLKPDLDRARATYCNLISDASNFAEGEWQDGELVSVGLMETGGTAYAKKGFATVQVWIGSMAMLDRMIEWWDGRPVLRFLSLQFPSYVRSGMYRALRMRGFSRSGDMNMLWR